MKKSMNLVRSKISAGNFTRILISAIDLVKVGCKTLTSIVINDKVHKKVLLVCQLASGLL